MNTKKTISRKADKVINTFNETKEESIPEAVQPDTQLTLAASKGSEMSLHSNIIMFVGKQILINLSTADRQIEKETLKEYIGKKRDMFLVQVSQCKTENLRYNLYYQSGYSFFLLIN